MKELLIILNLIFLETLLSIDNAAVLAIMVKNLPKNLQSKALKYGILGAFVFRGICLFIATIIIKILWLKIIGGLYLIWLAVCHFFFSEEGKDIKPVNKNFWLTVLMVEIMDIAFSMDNVFAAVAFTENIYLILIGVFIGIVSMRFVAQSFTNLMDKFPSLINSAFYVILLLGGKLTLSGILDYSHSYFSEVMKSNGFEICFSLLMLLLFLLPTLKSKTAIKIEDQDQ